MKKIGCYMPLLVVISFYKYLILKIYQPYQPHINLHNNLSGYLIGCLIWFFLLISTISTYFQQNTRLHFAKKIKRLIFIKFTIFAWFQAAWKPFLGAGIARERLLCTLWGCYACLPLPRLATFAGRSVQSQTRPHFRGWCGRPPNHRLPESCQMWVSYTIFRV